MKKSILFGSIIFSVIVIVGASIYVQAERKDQISEGEILYSIQEYKTTEESFYSLFRYNKNKKTIAVSTLQDVSFYGGLSTPLLFHGGLVYLRQDTEIESSLKLVRFFFESQKSQEWDLDVTNTYQLQVTDDGSRVAYEEVININDNMAEGPWYYGAKWRTIVQNLDSDEQIELRAEDFVYQGRKMEYIRPAQFSGNNILYLLASPHQSFDRGSPFVLYQINLTTLEKEEVLFLGYPMDVIEGSYDEKLYQRLNPTIFQFGNIYSDRGFMLLEKGMDERRLIQYDLETRGEKELFSEDLNGKNFSLPERILNRDPLSPNGRRVILSLGDEFIVCDFVTGQCPESSKIRGSFNSWRSDSEILYQEFRNNSWSDQYYSLMLLNINTGEKEIVYTQTIDHVQGAGLTQHGDRYYQLVGVTL